MILNKFKIQIILFFIFMSLFSISLQIGTMSQVSDEEANSFVQDYLSQKKQIDGTEIFLKNTTVLLPMFVPGFGIAWGLYSAWSTGFGYAALVSMAPGLANIAPLSILFQTPYGIMEIIAYSMGLSCSANLVFLLIKKVNPKVWIKPIVVQIGIALALLLGGGFVEEYFIKLGQ